MSAILTSLAIATAIAIIMILAFGKGTNVFKWLFASRGGLTHAELDKGVHRNKFSKYLPYIAYDDESEVYLNTDNTIGRIWECSPLNFAGQSTITQLEGIFKLSLPEKSIIQFILYADDYIDPIVAAHKRVLIRDNAVLVKTRQKFCDFLVEGKNGVEALGGTPLRNHRLFFTVKIPVEKYKEFKFSEIAKNIESALTKAYLYPENMEKGALTEMLRRFFNGHAPDFSGLANDEPSVKWDLYDDIPIRKQIIFAETEIKESMDYMKVGDSYFKCLTPKEFPSEVNPAQTNKLFGGIDMSSDQSQYKTPYLYAFNIVFHDLNPTIHAKANLILRQEGIGSWAPSLMRKKEEYMWAVDNMGKDGTKFVRVMPILWLKGKTKDECVDATARARGIWQGQGYTMQDDKWILKTLFISSLPFGLYDTKKNIKNLERDFIAPSTSVSQILPVQGDFLGGGRPVQVFTGRKGQVSGLDIFNAHASSHNMYIAAATGMGKSFLVNDIVLNYFGAGAIIRMIDIGNSYKKMTKILGARFLDFSPESDIVINPFYGIDPKEFNEEVESIAAVIFRMAFSATTGEKMQDDYAESANTLIKAAVRWAWKTEGEDADIGTVFTFLNKFPIHATEFDLGCEENDKCTENLQSISKILAFNLTDFTPSGIHGRWFNGKGNFNIAHDEFVVLELGNLKSQPELFRVATMQVINAVARDLYQSDRKRSRLIVFDEAHQFANEGNIIGRVIENGYRLARKYNGSFSIVTQSPLDLDSFGKVGEIIRGQSAFKMYLESVDFDRAKARGIIDYDEFTMVMLKSLKSYPPRYSEIFLDTPFGLGVTRLVKDPFSYYLNTSKPSEVTEIEDLVDGGMSYTDAIDAMVSKYRSN